MGMCGVLFRLKVAKWVLVVMSCERVSISLTKSGTKFEVFALLAPQKIADPEILGSDKQRGNMLVMMNRKSH